MQTFKPKLADGALFEIGMTVYTNGGRKINTTGCVVTREQDHRHGFVWHVGRENDPSPGLELNTLQSTPPPGINETMIEYFTALREAREQHESR